MEGISTILAAAIGHHQAGRFDEAVSQYEKLVAAGIRVPILFQSLGAARLALGQADGAIRALDEATRLDPNSAPVFANLGHALTLAGRWREAADAYAKAVALDARFAEALVEQGVCLEHAGDMAAGEACFVRASKLDAKNVRIWALLGRAYHRRRALDLAIDSYRHGVAVKDDAADLWNNLGAVLHERGALDDAQQALTRAVTLAPEMAQAHANLGSLLADRDDRAGAKAAYARALACDPANVGARLGACFAELQILYDSAEAIDAARARYVATLDATIAALDLEAPGIAAAVAAAVGQHQPFFLPYQARNDVEPQRRYGNFVCEAMAKTYPQWVRPLALPPRGADGRLRVGFVTAYFRRHSIWKLFRGWMENLDRSRFAVHGYWTGAAADDQTPAARAACERFVEGLGFEAMAEAIRADAPHVLVYPEIGMDPVSHKLATLRLAPVQCATWGHPETTGLPTMDWFLTSDLMEPPGEAARYSERVHRLPNISIDYEAPSVVPAVLDAGALGLREGAIRYLCCQSIFKYLPQDDDILARIAERVPDSQFVFLGHPTATNLTGAFKARVSASFAARGLDPEHHVVVLPQQDGPRYAGLNAISHLFLDSLRWSGGNTTLEAVAQGLPALTWPGDQMRGRHSYAILTMMGLDDGIASDPDDYVERAVRFGTDRAALAAYRARTVERRGLLWRDRSSTEALAAFLERVGGGA